MTYSQEQARAMYDALRIAYGLTAGMVDDIRDAGDDLGSADLACARRHMLVALRRGFGSEPCPTGQRVHGRSAT